MNADEIVGALRICNRSKGHRCSECPVFSRYEHGVCKATVDRFAADLIESLRAENERLAIHGGRYMQLADERYKMFERAIKRADDAETQLSASQRRERAARNELCLKCGRYRESHNGACDGCRWKE